VNKLLMMDRRTLRNM